MIQAFLLYLCLASRALANNIRFERVQGLGLSREERVMEVDLQQPQDENMDFKVPSGFASTARLRESPYPRLNPRQVKSQKRQRAAGAQLLNERRGMALALKKEKALALEREMALALERDNAMMHYIINNASEPSEVQKLRWAFAGLSVKKSTSPLVEKVRLENVPTDKGPVTCTVYSVNDGRPTQSILDLVKKRSSSATPLQSAAQDAIPVAMIRGSPPVIPSAIPTIKRSPLKPRRRFRL